MCLCVYSRFWAKEYELHVLDGNESRRFPPSFLAKQHGCSVHPALVYSFSATYRDSVVLWHIAELVAYRDNGII